MTIINIRSSRQQIEVKSGQSLMTTLVHAGVFVDNPCNGKGTCGKCKVQITSGEVNEPCQTESGMLTQDEFQQGIRLACFIYPENDLSVEVIQKEKQHKILTSGHTPEFQFKPAVRNKTVSLAQASLENQVDYETLVKEAFEVDAIHWKLLRDSPKNQSEIHGLFYKDEIVEITHDEKELYGIAIDIGTTTVVAALVDLKTGKEIGTASMINPQKSYGLDVLTRITYAIENQEKAKAQLQESIVQGINNLIGELIKDLTISKEDLHEVVVAGNTTMLHLLLGIESSVIGKAPFAPVFVRSKTLRASEIGIQAGRHTMLYCMPSVSAYIGADIVAGSYVCGLHKKKETVLFIDIGTNGEIVLAHQGRLISCSCAAGPALEGMNISAGMRAQEGAIEELSIRPNGILTEVIGDTRATGLCGSGILAVLREMIKTGIVTKKGAMIKLDSIEEDDYRRRYIRLNNKKRELVIREEDPAVIVTQSDVRQVQLAKGALLSGFYALLGKVGITMDSLDQVVVAGQFGAHLSVESLVGTGILPIEVKDKLTYVGNASKTGAYMALMSIDVRREIELLADRMEYMELGATEGYERLFAKCLLFE